MVNHNCNKNITLKMTGIPTETIDIHRAVHRNIISIVKPTRCTNVSNLPYFSIDNLHLMYNAHPKLFRHSF